MMCNCHFWYTKVYVLVETPWIHLSIRASKFTKASTLTQAHHPFHPQQHTVTSPNPLQQTDPEYEEAIKQTKPISLWDTDLLILPSVVPWDLYFCGWFVHAWISACQIVFPYIIYRSSVLHCYKISLLNPCSTSILKYTNTTFGGDERSEMATHDKRGEFEPTQKPWDMHKAGGAVDRKQALTAQVDLT